MCMLKEKDVRLYEQLSVVGNRELEFKGGF